MFVMCGQLYWCNEIEQVNKLVKCKWAGSLATDDNDALKKFTDAVFKVNDKSIQGTWK